MALQSSGVQLPGNGMTLVANAESPTKILCLTEVVPDFNSVLLQVKDKRSRIINVLCLQEWIRSFVFLYTNLGFFSLGTLFCFMQAISADQLKDDEEYEEILEDMRDECGKFGIYIYLFCYVYFLLISIDRPKK